MSSKKNPLISIVTPVYNAEKYISETLESALAQTYKNWEQILIIDANSSDRSLDIAKEFASQDNRFRIFQSESYKGATKNRNAGLDLAQGEYLAFLDADDIWLPQKLEDQINFMLRESAMISCHDYTPVNEGGEKAGPIRSVPLEIDFNLLLEDNKIGCTTVMIRRDFLSNRRFFEVKHEDFILWLTLLKDGTKAKGLQKNLSFYRVTRASLSGNKMRAALWRWKAYRHLGLPVGSSLSLMAKYAVNSIAKRVGS